MGQVFGCVRVKQSKVAVREHFGKFDGVLQPGCHCVPWCFGFGVAGKLSLRVEQTSFKCEAKTKDNVFVNVTTSVQLRLSAEQVEDAFYKLKNTTDRIQNYVFSAIRANVAKLDLDAVFKEKNGIAKAVQDDLEKAMSAYGYEMIETLIVEIEPHGTLKNAMNDTAVAKERLVAARQGKTKV